MTPQPQTLEQRAEKLAFSIWQGIAHSDGEKSTAELTAIIREVDELKKREEQHIMQLAAISTASVSNTPSTWAECHKCHDDYKSTAFFDVLKAVHREMDNRADRDSLQKENEGLRQCIVRGCVGGSVFLERDELKDKFLEKTNSLIHIEPDRRALCSHEVMAAYDKLMTERDSFREKCEQLEREPYSLHSCSPDCQRTGCVNRRKAEALDWLLNWNVQGHPFKTFEAITQAMKEEKK